MVPRQFPDARPDPHDNGASGGFGLSLGWEYISHRGGGFVSVTFIVMGASHINVRDPCELRL